MRICAKNQGNKEFLRHMKFVIQRVAHADVVVDGKELGKIGKGFMVLIGVSKEDDKVIADKMVDKMIKLRIFEDENGKTNLSLDDVGGELLLISQFTLYANCKKGNRPSFIDAGAPDEADALYEYIIEKCKERVNVVERGEFGADMKVSLLNDGPFTILLDSAEIM
jgi:D-tyrosyl-tRNA(Tyr) deacylase